MQQIDQDPRDYRAEPLKGEPIFVPGAKDRVLAVLIWLLIGIGVSVTVQFLFGGMIVAFADTVTNWVFS